MEQLNTKLGQGRHGGRRNQRAEQAAFSSSVRASAATRNSIFENRGKSRHDTFLSGPPRSYRIQVKKV
jgi:hypothetical protein